VEGGEVMRKSEKYLCTSRYLNNFLE